MNGIGALVLKLLKLYAKGVKNYDKGDVLEFIKICDQILEITQNIEQERSNYRERLVKNHESNRKLKRIN